MSLKLFSLSLIYSSFKSRTSQSTFASQRKKHKDEFGRIAGRKREIAELGQRFTVSVARTSLYFSNWNLYQFIIDRIKTCEFPFVLLSHVSNGLLLDRRRRDSCPPISTWFSSILKDVKLTNSISSIWISIIVFVDCKKIKLTKLYGLVDIWWLRLWAEN